MGLLLLAIIAWSMGQYDYARLVAGKRPLFAQIRLHLADGGSVQYLGPGYTLTELHELRWGIDITPEMEPGSPIRVTPFRVGQILDYWTPFVSRENAWLIFETNEFNLKHTSRH